MFFEVFKIVFPLIVIALAGFLYTKYQKTSMQTTDKINIDFFIPIMIFYYLSEKLPSISEIGTFALGGVMVVFGSAIVIYPFIKIFKLNANTFLPPMMFNNSINLGLPLALFAFGQEAMSLAISLSIVQVIGQFTIGATLYGGKFEIQALLKNPVIVATIFGLSFNYLDVHLPALLLVAFKMLAQVSIPLVLFSLGAKLTSIEIKYWKIGLLGAILCPLSGIIMALLAIYIFDYTALQTSLIILFGALPPAVLNAIMAQKYDNDSIMVASVVAFGTLFAIIFIPIVLYFIM